MNAVITAHRLLQVLRHLQAVGHQQVARLGLVASVSAPGEAHLRTLRANPRVLSAFAAAHPADQASARRAAAGLRRLGAKGDDQFAALIHDLPKGRVGLLPRVLHVLEGSPVTGRARGPLARARQTLRQHAMNAPKLATKLGAPRGSIAMLHELARQEANAPHKATALSARAALLLDLDSGVAR